MAPARDFQSDGHGAVSWRPGKLWSLWDVMINFQVIGLYRLLHQLWGEEREVELRIAVLEHNKRNPNYQREMIGSSGMYVDEMTTDQDADRITGWLAYATSLADQLELQAVHDRIAIFSGKMRHVRIRLYDYLAEVRTLKETFEQGINFKHFYRYPQSKAMMLATAEPDWKKVTDAFPACKEDAVAAIDCYALGHATASVFHSMRVAEHGLRAVAKERKIRLHRNRPIEWATWQDIIREIDKEISAIGNKKAGNARDAALEFYSGARADLNGFKDEYRNLVMHVRAKYDELQALRAITNVHGFMGRITAKIDHKHHRIRWGLR